MIKKWIGIHIFAIMIGCIVALIIASPHIRSWYLVDQQHFEGVYVPFVDDEVYYQARIKAVVDGKFGIGNPYIKEHMNDNSIMPPLAEWCFAGIVWVSGLSVPLVTSFGDFVLGFVDFLLIYILFLNITQKHKWISLFYTLSFMVFSLTTFGRPISPQFNAIFLFVGLITVVYLYKTDVKNRIKWNLVLGCIIGITCFISPYYFTALFILYFMILITQTVFIKKTKIIENAPWFFVSFTPLGLWYLLLQLNITQFSAYHEVVLRFGLMFTHIPGSFTNIMFGCLALVVVCFAYRYIKKDEFVISIGFVSTIFILNWQNIITGRSLQFSSHYLFITILFILITLAIIHTSIHNRDLSMKERGILFYILIFNMICLYIIILFHQKNEFTHIMEMPYTRTYLIAEQQKMQVYQWFTAHSAPGSVVYTLGGSYDFNLPIYTQNKVYYNFYATLFMLPNIETENRWLLQHLFDADMSLNVIQNMQRDFWGNTYIDTYQSLENRRKIKSLFIKEEYKPTQMVPLDHVLDMYYRWKDLKKKQPIDALRQYSIDYILLSYDYPYYTETKNLLDTTKGVVLVAHIQGSVPVYIYSVH